MQITYFVISIIEILLTAFLIFIILKADKKLSSLLIEFKSGFKTFLFKFKKIAIILSSSKKILKLYKVYQEETKKIKSFYKAIKNLKNSIMLLLFLLGIKNRKKQK